MTRGRPVKRRKRSSGEGSIYKRVIKGVTYWSVRVTLPDGTRSKAKYFRTHEEAKEALLKVRIEVASGVLPSDMTFRDWSAHWLSAKVGVKQKTLDQYKHYMAVASGFFGNKQLAKIQAHDLEIALKAIRNAGRSANTVRKLYTVLSACLRTAYKRGLIARDIADQVDAPKATKRKPVILGRADWNNLINASRNSDRELIIEFVVKTGMRINEALSIRWGQVDSDNASVTVGDSKTEAGAGRTIPLDQSLLARLTTLRSKHFEIQLQFRDWNPTGLVFCTGEGNFQSYQNLQRRVLSPLLKQSGLPHLTWHHLRYNAGSYLLSENVPITVVSKILGHANPGITMSIYAHELPEDFALVRQAMAKFA